MGVDVKTVGPRGGLVGIVASAKHSHLARVASFPFMNIQFARRDRVYLRSADSEMVKAMCNVHAGQRCFIVGNGPSLTAEDLDRLTGEITFAANRIYNVFDRTLWRPTYYIATDREFIAQETERLGDLARESAFINLTPFSKRLSGHGNIVLINKRPRYFSTRKYNTGIISFSGEPWRYVGEGYTVTYQAMQLALFMGFKDIYLIGMDHEYGVWADSLGRVHSVGGILSHCYEDKPGEHLNPFYVEGVEFAYRVADIAATRSGARIFNATRGGALEVFERVDFSHVIDFIDVEGKDDATDRKL